MQLPWRDLHLSSCAHLLGHGEGVGATAGVDGDVVGIHHGGACDARHTRDVRAVFPHGGVVHALADGHGGWRVAHGVHHHAGRRAHGDGGGDLVHDLRARAVQGDCKEREKKRETNSKKVKPRLIGRHKGESMYVYYLQQHAPARALTTFRQGSPPKFALVAGMEHELLPMQAAVTTAVLLAELHVEVAKVGQLPVGVPKEANNTLEKTPARHVYLSA